MSVVSEDAWVNGELVARERGAPSVASSSFHMGTGVFDGLMAYWNDHWYLHRVDEHLERFKRGCRNMDLAFDWSTAELEAGIRDLLERVPRTTHYIRPIAFRGGPELMLVGSRGLPVDVCIFGVPVTRDHDELYPCHLSEVSRISSQAIPVAWKICGTYVNSYLAQLAAEQAGFKGAVMCDRHGRIAEATTANIFFIDGQRLVTPALSGDIFPGITRAMILEIAAALNLETVERDVEPLELDTFEAAFVCATLMEIRAVSRIGSQRYDKADRHPVFAAIRAEFRRLTHQ